MEEEVEEEEEEEEEKQQWDQIDPCVFGNVTFSKGRPVNPWGKWWLLNKHC
jgi:hypothetical protein